MTKDLQPDPSVIGGVPEAPFAFLPEPVALFTRRAGRFAFLAQTSRLAPYLTFLSDLSELQARLAKSGPAPVIAPEQLARAKAAQMPPVDRASLAADPALDQLLTRLCEGAARITMPEPARLALEAVTHADPGDRTWLLQNALSGEIPADSAAPHLFASAAVQIYLARLAASLDAGNLRKIGTGICPCCGGRPVSSLVTSTPGIESIRYGVCGLCATQWNEVRIHCLACGTNKGLTYRSAETTEATVKAECCRECHSWIKIFYQERNPSLDAVADDVGSIGLDMMMKETDLKRAGLNPYLTGY
ncbi:formate dehydrogenase accessory protein FdhE [Xinfangfangia sp. D13-10-4-6]|uniref:formate dehydrogenase accessory protein FdhE n=1 Tax=Pseudogemmobacter hezensis TaxID=2737662 RepID=UPI0015578883|nr:formate dehydrogenase accessory protein FdhE [Pseudogemmobacter hezensis]NPD13847.1 formate dehydrogenase accessory protein FdhE [Pseudogemmobacter hezensis]